MQREVPPALGDLPGWSDAVPSPGCRLQSWWARHVQIPWRATRHEPPPPPSGYLTLIPLSDSRLRQPTDTRITAVFLLLFAMMVAGAVFVTVPRGVSVGEISVRTDKVRGRRSTTAGS